MRRAVVIERRPIRRRALAGSGSGVVSDATFKIGRDRDVASTRLGDDENPPILKMAEREDWTLFRTVEGLQQKAGVPVTQLRRLVLKELGDNGFDSGATVVRAGRITGSKFFVEDDGPGLGGSPEQIAALFCIRRPLRSTKLLRLPQRGALGNGLRIVAGVVLASQGSLTVVTNRRRIVLQPQSDGSTAVVKVSADERPAGTRIEIGFGPAVPNDADALAWLKLAGAVAGHGENYTGHSSPYWYDAAHFHELLLAYGTQPARGVIAQLDGCSGGTAGEIIAAAGVERLRCCKDIDRAQATKLLKAARKRVRPVSPKRLGSIGHDAFGDRYYADARGSITLGGSQPQAEIPFVVEVWAEKFSGDTDNASDDIHIDVLINRTPTVAEVSAWRSRQRHNMWLRGAGLGHYCNDAPKKGEFNVFMNVTTPYCPITSDGKAPDLAPFAAAIITAIETAMRKAQRAAPKNKKVPQKDVVLDSLDEAIAAASGDGEFRFNERQIFYQLRPIVLQEIGEELKIDNFKGIITAYENEYGEIEGMYREPRGSIYHPHRGDDIPLGTLTVENYERPVWTFNKILYVEKEGFSEALKDDGWPERHDCALISSKGFTTRAARDLIDKLAEHDEPVEVFCVTDADNFGGIIHQTFQEATRARGARKIRIIHLGLHPWEAIEAGLEVEKVKESDKRKPVANYVLKRQDLAPNGETWEEWLQTHRVELNAMTTPEFIEWLDRKMAEHRSGKLIPPDQVLAADLEVRLTGKVRAALTERILREAGLDQQVDEALAAIKRPTGAALARSIEKSFARQREREWRDHVDAVAEKFPRQLGDCRVAGNEHSKQRN
jgi:hypothetical protein